MKRNKKKLILLIPIIVLFCTLPNVSAMFRNQGNASNGARVASFNIQETGTLTDYIKENISPGEDIEKTIELKNSSEVAVDCTITIKNESQNINTLGVTLSGEEITKDESNSNANTWTYIIKGLEPNQSDAKEYTLTLNWPFDSGKVDSNLEDIGKVDYFTITVTATQVD